MRALELDAFGRQAERLVDDEICHHRHHPADRDVGVQAEDLAQRLEHVELHQHQRDQRVEHHPHHATRVAVGQPREEVRPRERARIGIGHVDFQLRNHDQQRGRRDRPGLARKHVLVGSEVHLVRVDRALERHRVADRQIREQRTAEHFDDARHDPARAADQHAGPPANLVLHRTLRHEAQVVDLLAHLRDKRDADRHRGTEELQIELRAPAVGAAEMHELGQHTRVLLEHEHIRHDQQHQPQWLRPHLQAADDRHAVGHERNDDQGADQVAPRRRDVERELERVGHDRRLEREEDEGEARVDERGDGRADVAEAGAACQQVHVDAVACGVAADRPAGEEDDQPRREDRPECVDETVLDEQRRAHRFEHQERRCAERGVCDTQLRPLAKTVRREAQRVVFHRLARDPAVVVATHLDDALHRTSAHRSVHGRPDAWRIGRRRHREAHKRGETARCMPSSKMWHTFC